MNPPVSTPAPIPQTKKISKTQMSIVFGLLVLICLYRFVFFGSILRTCEFTVSEGRPVPTGTENGAVWKFEKEYQAAGVDHAYSCLKELNTIHAELVSPIDIDDPYSGAKQEYERQGRALSLVEAGSEFHVVRQIAITKHGIGTLDSGPGPIYYDILSDKSGELYIMWQN